MKIYFLSPEDACQKFVRSRYFEILQPLEINIRTHHKIPLQGNKEEMRNQARVYYCQNLLEFKPDEITAITWYVKMVCKIMQQKADQLIPKRWKFAKLRQHMDWNFPYTMGSAIVLPELKVREMVAAYCAKTPDLIVSGFKTIFHEAVHLHQKKNPSLYQKIYHDYWGFKCVDPENIFYQPFYIKYWVTNPDAMKINYIIPIIQPGTNQRVDWFLPLLILNPQNPNKVQGILIKLNEVYNKELCRYQYYTTMKYRTICSLKEYTEKFYGMDRQLYHPHEIMANLLTDYAVTYKEYTDAAFRSTEFYMTVDRLLNSRSVSSIGDHNLKLCPVGPADLHGGPRC